MTVRLSGAPPDFCHMYINEYSGASATDPLDRVAVRTGPNTPQSDLMISSGPSTTTTPAFGVTKDQLNSEKDQKRI